MSRSITSAADAAFTGENTPLLVFAQLNFDSGVTRVTNNAYDLPWNGQTWIGTGKLGSIEPVQEGADLQAYNLTMRLSGVPTDSIAIALDEHYQGRACTVWAAPLDSDLKVIEDPIVVFSGRIDDMPIKLGEQATIELRAQSYLADWQRARVRRYNDADQRFEYPSDLGFQFVEQMVEKEIIWGRA